MSITRQSDHAVQEVYAAEDPLAKSDLVWIFGNILVKNYEASFPGDRLTDECR